MQDEKERLKRIREAQINSRDPGASKIRHYDWAKHAAKPQPKKKPFLLDMISVIPERWRGAVLGVLFGAIIGLVMWFLVLTPETQILMLLPILMCGIGGFILGKLWQDDTKIG